MAYAKRIARQLARDATGEATSSGRGDRRCRAQIRGATDAWVRMTPRVDLASSIEP